MLDFYNILLEHEADLQKPLHHTERERHKMPAFARIADKNRAVFVRLKDLKQLGRDFLNLIAEFRQ